MDDVIFLLLDPVNFITALEILLEFFAQVSGYKINISKSLLMGVNIPLESKIRITTIVAPPWNSCIKYLGIQLTDTMHPASLLDLNFTPIVRSTRAQLDRWHKLQLSWMDRGAALKMVILPKFIFAFCSLLLSIPLTMLNNRQREFIQFIWSGKKPRWQLSLLQKEKEEGGISVLI